MNSTVIMTTKSYKLSAQIPSSGEYMALRVAAGMSSRTREAADRGLPNSLFSVCVRNGNELIGMGRIVGDGGCNYEIVDIVVHPDYQRQGLGT